MFNWFRRQKVQPEQEQTPPAPVEETPSEATPTTSETTSQEEYLDWAKKAFLENRKTQRIGKKQESK